MKSTLLDAITHRRSIYSIDNVEVVSKLDLNSIVLNALTYVPSAFNSRSTRIVLLTGDNHTKLWDIVKECLEKITPKEAFVATQQKIDSCFAAGYATILFYEDGDVVSELQSKFALYADHFPIWSQQTSAMHQFAIWTMVDDAGAGASLQHYNPIIDDAVAREFDIPQSWKLIAQMPVGRPVAEPAIKGSWDAQTHLISL